PNTPICQRPNHNPNPILPILHDTLWIISRHTAQNNSNPAKIPKSEIHSPKPPKPPTTAAKPQRPVQIAEKNFAGSMKSSDRRHPRR
ncbi:hypothetical protein OSH11_17075, partial [Kaistia dalseonensis]|uniref:hypothetical protein n=1 Tax=Kaistia dalseonensis TaxID=410840 RepID=UPI00224FB5C8